MIQIDDAGSGSLIGGVCIAAIRVDTGQYEYGFIPVTLYQNGRFYDKKYLDESKNIVLSLIHKLNINKDEKIEICQGYMFDIVRDYLKENQYEHINTKIGEPLQSKIEETFNKYALDLGLPIQYVKYTKYPLHFHRILRWVYANYKERCKLCKTDWKSWKKYGDLDISISYDILYKKNYSCLRCGKKINSGHRVKVLKYISNCPNTIYLHPNCRAAIRKK